MRLLCRLFDCAFDLIVVDGGPLRMSCTRCGCQSPGVKLGAFLLLLSLAAPAQAQTKECISFAALASTAGIDGAQTVRCVKAGTCAEANPLYRPVAGSYAGMALVKSGLVTGTILTAKYLKKRNHPRLAWAVVIGVTAAQGAAIAWNAQQIRKVKR